MPLSEQEQRLLDEMERNLYRTDADVMSTVGDPRRRPSYRSIAIGALIVIAGLGGLLAGVLMHQPIIGVAGFVVMFAGVLVALVPGSRADTDDFPPSSSTSGDSSRASASSAGFMDRMNDRWDRRSE